MATITYAYEPDYAVPPGQVLEEHLDAREMSHAEFARRCGRSPKLISEIIAGKAPVEPRTALQFERVLGMDASIWLGIDAEYRLHKAREAERAKANEVVEWARRFPVNELVKRRAIEKPRTPAERVSTLLSFFGVASVESWELKYASAQVAYRHSPSFESNQYALAAWLRLGELKAERIECSTYDDSTFRQVLHRVRGLTAQKSAEILPVAEQLCAQSGVAFTIVKQLPKTPLSGASRWLTPQKALIQLSGRHLREDQLWFSFFHEAAHILLHGKKHIFVDKDNGEKTDEDVEADRWASDFLVPRAEWNKFVRAARFSARSVQQFARRQGVAPGIVVGRLQHEEAIPWSNLNSLKVGLEWRATEED